MRLFLISALQELLETFLKCSTMLRKQCFIQLHHCTLLKKERYKFLMFYHYVIHSFNKFFVAQSS